MKQPQYDSYARFYDYFELAGYAESEELNEFLTEIFKLNSVKSVLDFACGTGAQAIGLAKENFAITAADLSAGMLEQAKKKAGNLPINFIQGNMIELSPGKFDAAICIFNAIGHLSKADCKFFFKNALSVLDDGGLFVVDILNYEAMANAAFEDYKQMEGDSIIDGYAVHHVRHCELNDETKTIVTNSRTFAQDGINEPLIVEDNWEMQLYKVDELTKMLTEAGFSEVQIFGPRGTDFIADNSDSILAICQK
jgi:cyclopropane fatty-acyl-phospholipid synthase-like methyltransferase